ncbi:MAG: AEC family transporter [Eubacteriales bacterium]
MEISILLGSKICSMLLACLVGYVLVKGKVLATVDSKVISKIIAYVCSPCAILNAFLIELTSERLTGMIITVIVACIWHAIVIGGTRVIGGTLHMNEIEKASVIYSNAGYIVIPIVSAILGGEWVLYTTGYIVVQTFLYWTHCTSLLYGNKKTNWAKVLKNPNLIAMYIGVVIFVFQIPFPEVVQSSVNDFSTMVGAIAMLVIGMLIGEQNLLQMFKEKKVYIVCFFRLLVIPLLTATIFVCLQQVLNHADIHYILLIVLWSASAPVGTMVTQLAQIYELDSQYAGKINLVSVLFCIVTMPIITYYYEWLSQVLF